MAGEDDAASPPFLHMWRVTDIAWPTPLEARAACMGNVKELLRNGVRITAGVDAFDIGSACRRMGIRDVHSVGLVLWTGPHPRRHNGQETLLQAELKHLNWTRAHFLAAAIDMLSSSLPQATVIACDEGDWAEGVLFPLDHKPLITFRTHFGTVDGHSFRSEASGFDDRHVRPWDTDEFVGCGLVAPFLQPFILGQKVVDIPALAIAVAQAGLHVIFVGEYTCAQSRHCLRLALAERPAAHRMLCDRPWGHLPVPRRGWQRGSEQSYTLEEIREDAYSKVRQRLAEERWPFAAMHAANNWTLKSLPRGRAGLSDFGHVMWPAGTI